MLPEMPYAAAAVMKSLMLMLVKFWARLLSSSTGFTNETTGALLCEPMGPAPRGPFQTSQVLPAIVAVPCLEPIGCLPAGSRSQIITKPSMPSLYVLVGIALANQMSYVALNTLVEPL